MLVAQQWGHQIFDDAAAAGLDLDGDGHAGITVTVHLIFIPKWSACGLLRWATRFTLVRG